MLGLVMLLLDHALLATHHYFYTILCVPCTKSGCLCVSVALDLHFCFCQAKEGDPQSDIDKIKIVQRSGWVTWRVHLQFPQASDKCPK